MPWFARLLEFRKNAEVLRDDKNFKILLETPVGVKMNLESILCNLAKLPLAERDGPMLDFVASKFYKNSEFFNTRKMNVDGIKDILRRMHLLEIGQDTDVIRHN
jgi:hypothetical protein